MSEAALPLPSERRIVQVWASVFPFLSANSWISSSFVSRIRRHFLNEPGRGYGNGIVQSGSRLVVIEFISSFRLHSHSSLFVYSPSCKGSGEWLFRLSFISSQVQSVASLNLFSFLDYKGQDRRFKHLFIYLVQGQVKERKKVLVPELIFLAFLSSPLL